MEAKEGWPSGHLFLSDKIAANATTDAARRSIGGPRLLFYALPRSPEYLKPSKQYAYW